jgi:hypothetical protein
VPLGPRAHRTYRLLPAVTVAFWTVIVAHFVILGADLLWVVALGDTIRSTGSVPDGIPFAVAEQSEWHNPIVVAQLLLSVVHGWGDVALAALQVAAVAATLAVVVADGRRLGGQEAGIAGVVTLVVIGAIGTFVIVRLPSLSLVPFVLAVFMMRRQHESSDRRIWLLVPLFILWGNLHGGVLVGLAVLGVFLVASPGGGPGMRRVAVGLGCASSLVLTSAFTDTPAYYVSALGNEAAARGTDLWARPDPNQPLDFAMILVVLVLGVRAARRRPPLWEGLAMVGLLIGTASAARHGVWLILFLAPAAVRPRGERADRRTQARPQRDLIGMVGVIAVATVAACVVLAVRAPAVGPPGDDSVDGIRAVAGGRPVLADEPLAETLAQQGILVWAANPIDAFTRPVQVQFLDFLHDGTEPVDAGDIEVAAVSDSIASTMVESGAWTETRRVGDTVVLERRP